MSSPSLKGQVWALLRRYNVTLLQYPIYSAFRIILLPVLILGPSIYFVIRSKDEEYTKQISLEPFIPIVSIFVTLFHSVHLTNRLVTDKASGIKSLMLLMGLKRNSYYLGNFIYALELFLPPMIIIAIVSLIYLFQETQTSSITIALVYLLFVIHLGGCTFALTSAINSSVFAIVVIILLLLAEAILLHSSIIWLMHKVDKGWWPLILFVGSSSPYESLRIFTNSYALCKNCDKTDLSDNLVSQPVYLILIAMTFWTLFVYAFTRWFDEVCPWQDVTAIKNPLFCIKSSRSIQELDAEESPERRSKYFEKSASGREVGIHITKITKSYRGKPVVNDISFNIYKGETTLLLGHNGAGKTTLMSLILGKLSPDRGSVQVKDNYAMKDDHDGLGIGVCPQLSILDDDLTVKQHLELFSDIKSAGMSHEERKRHIAQTIADVSLTEHRNKRPPELSGGMKRKLSLAMAFVGHSSILILDEPSSGLDPDSRVFIWDAIRRYRADRTVLLSTQHMEEADYLGDRIAIMKEGKIICCGSPMFLNKVFGTGYKLRVACPDSTRQQVINFVKKFFKSAKLEDSETSTQVSINGKEVIKDFVLELLGDKNSDQEVNLIQMLERFESPSTIDHLKIRSYGLKSSSIEDILLSTTKDLTEDIPDALQLTLTNRTSHMATITNPVRSSSSTFIANQKLFLYAFLMKHLQTYKKEWKLILCLRVFLITYFTLSLSFALAGSPKIMEMQVSLGQLVYSPNLGLAFLVFHMIYFPSVERTTKFKIIQLSSHANHITYWLAFLIADTITVLFMIICSNLFFSITYTGNFGVSSVHVHLLLTSSILLFGLASALLAYVLSLMINTNSVGYFLFIMGIPSAFYSLTILLGLTLDMDVAPLRNVLNYIFIAILPSEALNYINFGLGSKCYLTHNNCIEKAGFSPVLHGFLCLFLQTVFYGSMLHFIESNNLDLGWYLKIGNLWPFPCRSVPPSESYEVDKDVVDETTKAMQSIDKDQLRQPYSMVAADLNKNYNRNTRKAVDHLSFTVNRGECFGLLGVNGAGKTTTFSMLVAESKPDSGRVWLNGCFNTEDVDKYRRRLSYDPQSSPETSLSPVDALFLMARLRRLDEQSIAALVNSILEILDMSEHANKSSNELSGGTKRKLTLAMSLVGNPSLLALDEPTAGVDPLARRSVWQLLRTLRSQCGTSIIISSHAMEECEAICDRISIMARGRLRCIGTFLHLKSKFARGFTLRVQISGSDQPEDDSINKKLIVELADQLRSKFGSTSIKLVDTHINGASFSLLNSVARSSLFKLMREFRQSHERVNYTINDSSLEDVFIGLAREQQQLEQLSSSASNIRQQIA